MLHMITALYQGKVSYDTQELPLLRYAVDCKGALLFQAQIMGTKSFHSKLKLISNLTHQQHQRPRCVHCLHLPFYFLVFDAWIEETER